MFRPKQNEIWAAEIGDYLNKPLIGENFKLTDFHSIQTERWLRRRLETGQKIDQKILVISEKPVSGVPGIGQIISSHPELDLALVIREFFSIAPINEIHPSAILSEQSRLGRNVMVGPYSVIGPDVEIADNTQVYGHVVIHGPARIGRWCTVKDGAVIGSEGWGFLTDEEGTQVHPPQLGTVMIEDHVWIGSNSTIERPTADETRISTNVKIDDLVHIGGGTRIGQNCEILAGTVISANVFIDKDVSIAPQVVVRENLRIGEGALVGQGSVVVKNVEAGQVYVGNPAHILRARLR
jgi:UDP-3-O-[3-hydroxymyristoyl] glucosamine N-acyltransferase